jgi:hypothetical protein
VGSLFSGFIGTTITSNLRWACLVEVIKSRLILY